MSVPLISWIIGYSKWLSGWSAPRNPIREKVKYTQAASIFYDNIIFNFKDAFDKNYDTIYFSFIKTATKKKPAEVLKMKFELHFFIVVAHIYVRNVL